MTSEAPLIAEEDDKMNGSGGPFPPHKSWGGSGEMFFWFKKTSDSFALPQEDHFPFSMIAGGRVNSSDCLASLPRMWKIPSWHLAFCVTSTKGWITAIENQAISGRRQKKQRHFRGCEDESMAGPWSTLGYTDSNSWSKVIPWVCGLFSQDASND